MFLNESVFCWNFEKLYLLKTETLSVPIWLLYLFSSVSSHLVIIHLLYPCYHLALHKLQTTYHEMTTPVQNPTYSAVASHNSRPENPYRYDRQVEVQVKFASPVQRFEIYDELRKLQFSFQTKLLAIIQLPGLRATFHARNREAAIELKEKLSLSSKVKEVTRFGENEIKIIMNRIPPQFKDSDIRQAIAEYAEVIRINVISDQYGIQTGTRHIFVKRQTMVHIPRYLQLGGVYAQIKYENQPSYCEYCKSQGHERPNCEELAKVRLYWKQKEEKQQLEGKTTYATPLTENPIVTSVTNNEQIPGNVDKDNFPPLESKKSKKRSRKAISPLDKFTQCCNKRLTEKRNTDHCTCGEMFYKCLCGQWQNQSALKKDPNCMECERPIIKCGPSCGFFHTLNKGEITTCSNCKQVYNDTGTPIGIHSL